MAQAFEAIARGEAWSYGALVHGGLDDVRDDEGRPVCERRAPSVAKQGTPMVLKACPYSDERAGQPMNVSALAQVSQHFEGVLGDLAAVRVALHDEESSAHGRSGLRWDTVLTAVVDELGAPALHLLRSPGSALPGVKAVAHKLAAGYFGVVRGLVRLDAIGRPRPVTVDDLLAYTRETRALVGASEVCASPPPLLTRASEVLVHGRPDAPPLEDAPRLRVARIYRQQIQLGMAFELFNDAFERRILPRLRLGRARTAFFEERLEGRAVELRGREGFEGDVTSALPRELPPAVASSLRRTLEGDRPRAVPGAADALAGDRGGIEFSSREDRRAAGDALIAYLDVYVAFAEALTSLEAELRTCLAFPAAPPVKLAKTVFPYATALELMESALGCRAALASNNASVRLAALPRVSDSIRPG